MESSGLGKTLDTARWYRNTSMTQRDRFLAVATGDTPDYVPIFGFSGSPGMAGGCMAKTHDRLVATGMPAHVGGRYALGGVRDVEGWYRYWGTTGPMPLDFRVSSGAEGFRETRRREGDFEFIESENGAVTRQVVDNDITYSNDRGAGACPRYGETPARTHS